MSRVRRGMTIEEVREIWLPRSETKTKQIMGAYDARRRNDGGGYGHEGLGVYGTYKERVAREKVRLAVYLLQKAGLEVSYQTIRKVTRQSESTIYRYWSPPKQAWEDEEPTGTEEPGTIIRFPGHPFSS